MAEVIVRAIISKEQGRNLIKKTPIDLFQKIADYSRRSGEKATKYYHYETVCSKYNTVTNTQLAILSLFNDYCAFCGKPFTHYVIGKPGYGIKHCILYPVRFEENGEIVYYNIDHILPKSLGGANRLENYQLTCEDLNGQKGNSLSEHDKKYGVKSNRE